MVSLRQGINGSKSLPSRSAGSPDAASKNISYPGSGINRVISSIPYRHWIRHDPAQTGPLLLRQAAFGSHWFREDRDALTLARDCGIPGRPVTAKRRRCNPTRCWTASCPLRSTRRTEHRVKGEQNDALCSAKHRKQGDIVQALMEPDEFRSGARKSSQARPTTSPRPKSMYSALCARPARLSICPTLADGGVGSHPASRTSSESQTFAPSHRSS